MSNPTYVIAISGPSGAGKSTLVRNLINLFGGAISLGIDDYPDDDYPSAVEWTERGANPDEFKTPQFFADVRALKEGQPIVHPSTKEEVKPPAYLILEEPFGKSRTALRPHIDFDVDIDVPHAVSLARRLLRIIGDPSQDDEPDETYAFIKRHLEWYLDRGRNFYLAVQENARKEKDVTIDGTLPSETIAKTVFEVIMAKQASQR